MVRTIRPRLETLEARDCPTAWVKLYPGGILRIGGDSAWDQVNIIQDDVHDTLTVYSSILPPPGDVTAQVVDIKEFQSSKINRITVDLNGGNDVFSYSLAEGTDLLNTKMVRLFTGRGDDAVSLSLANNVVYSQTLGGGESILPGTPTHSNIKASVGFTIDTGEGNDSLSFDVGQLDFGRVRLTALLGAGDDTFWMTDSCSIAGDTRLMVDVNGQEGKDSMFAMLYGEITGRADVNFRGGDGDDLLQVVNDGAITGGLYVKTWGGQGNDTLGVNATPRAESTGRLGLKLVGNQGDDQFQYDVGTAEACMTQMYNCVIRGGLGTDEAKISQKVATSSIEVLTQL